MRRVIFLFLDGVGIGAQDPTTNPLAAGDYPYLSEVLAGRRLTAQTGRYRRGDVVLAPLDAQMGVAGRPQSATGQAALLTGLNAPQLLGEHYGPRPDDRVRAVVDRANLMADLRQSARSPLFCNAYPQSYFDAVERGKRLLSVLPYAATRAGQTLLDARDLAQGRALAADFTGAGWRSQLGYATSPVYSAQEAGRRLWDIAQDHDFVLFEHWLTDMLGHRKRFAEAVANFQVFDAFLRGLVDAVGTARADTLIVIASDHGNVEDCSHGKHTENPALGMLIGGSGAIDDADATLHDLTGIAPLVRRFLRARDD